MKKPLSTGLAALFLIIQNTYGVDGTWTGASSTEWTDGTNWTSNPLVPDGTATFGNTGPSNVGNTGVFSVGTILFSAVPNAQSYTITIGNFALINGTGVINNSTNPQNFTVASDEGCTLLFQNASSASGGTGPVTYSNSGAIYFQDTSTAGNATLINNGVLQFSSSSSAGTAQITNNVALDFFDSATASSANLTNTGTVTFNNTSTASAATIINTGNVQFTGSSTASAAGLTNNGGGTIVFGNDATASAATMINIASIQFNDASTAASASITNNNGGTLAFNGTSTATNATTVTNNTGGVLDISGLTNGGISIGQVTGAGNIDLGANTLTVGGQNTLANIGGVISDGGAGGGLTKIGTATLILSGNSTYTGATAIQNGTLQVGVNNALPTGTAVTLNGAAGPGTALLDVNGLSQAIASLKFIAPTASSTVDVNGGTLTLTGNVSVVDNTTAAGNGFASVIRDTAGTGALDLGGAVRTFTIAGQNVSNTDLTVSAKIQNGGVIINAANSSTFGTSSGVNFTAANTYAGGTTINSGYLLANNLTGSATGTGAVTIQPGGHLAGNGTVTGLVTLNSGGALEAGKYGVGHGNQGTLHVGAVDFNAGGQINLELGTSSDLIAVTGAFNKGGAGTYAIQLTDAGGIGNQTHYQLVTFASSTFAATDFSLAPTSLSGLTGIFTLTGTELDFDLTGITVTGSIIQNSSPVNTPVIADFLVQGQVTTGGPGEDNTIHTLTFTSGSTLTVHNNLYVTLGPVILVDGSTITLDGNLSVSQLKMLEGSLLNGNGAILGDLINGGFLSPGQSPGHIRVSGNYTQTPTGTLKIEIGGRDASQHDLLSVGGTATLGGTLQLVRLNKFKLKRNQSVTFLTAGAGVNGEFATVENGFTSDTILEPTVVYHPDRVALEVKQGSFEAFADRWGLTRNQKSVARALDSVAFNKKANSLIDYLDYRKLDRLPGDFDRIAPEELTSIFTIGTSLAKVQSQNVQRRTDDIRGGSSGFSAAGLAVNGDNPSYSGGFRTGVAGPTGAESKEVKEAMPVADSPRWGVFLSGSGEWVSVGDTDNARGYDLTSGGFTFGIDYKVTPNFAIGLAAGYTGTSADLVDRGRVYVNGGKIGLYATYFQNEPAAAAPATMSKDASKDSSKEAPAPAPSLAKGFYADLAVFGGYNSYDTRRSALQGEARGDTDGGEVNALFGLGYDCKQGNLTFGPTATFNYTYLGTNEFTEHGSLAPLNIHGGKGESLRTALGLKASYDWKVGGILVRPEIRAAWQHEYGDAAYALDSSFANGAGHSFLVNGPELGRDSLLVGAGFAVQFNERLSTYFYYDGELGRKNYQSSSITGGLRFIF